MKKNHLVWLHPMASARKFAFVIICLLTLLIVVLLSAYLILQSDSAVTNDDNTLYQIPVRSILPEFKAIRVLSSEPEMIEEVADDKQLEEQAPPIPLVPKAEDSQHKSRRKSPLIVSNTKSTVSGKNPLPDNKQSEILESDGNQDANIQFLHGATGKQVMVSRAAKMTHLPYKILQGKMIEAVLIPKVNSDLPGMICATVQRDVYGEQGREKLIPWGSRLCGQYSTELKKGQGRLFAVWNELRTPDGIHVTLDSVSADQLGTAGMGGYVDNHFASVFGASALLAIIGTGGTKPHRYRRYDDTAYYYQYSVRKAAAKTAEQLLAPFANLAPTVTVPAGTRVRIYVNKDLDFSVLKQQVNTDTIVIP